MLRHPVPRPACIDLGQPLFRRELFELHLGDDLPFDMMAWDWHLIETLMAARRPLEARRQAKLHLPARKVSPAIGWVGADLTAILGSG